MNERYPSEITDYSERLGVVRGATQEEIKKAYRKQATYWHPDKHPDTTERATEEFKAIGEAYETLSERTKEESFEFAEDRSYDFYSEMFDKIFGKNSIYFEMFKIVPELEIIMKLFERIF